MKAHTKQTQEAMSPDAALQALKDGNKRFITSTQVSRDLMQQVADTSAGQYPFAYCITLYRLKGFCRIGFLTKALEIYLVFVLQETL